MGALKFERCLVAGGKEIPVPFDVLTWRTTGRQFTGLKPRQRTDLFVYHWTGANNLAPVMYRNMRLRNVYNGLRLVKHRLSVHLGVDPNGLVHQFADLDMRCAHAGTLDDWNKDGHELSGNATSVGAEFVNPATLVRDPAVATLTAAGVERAVVREEIHGVEQRRTAFTVEQMYVGLELATAVCSHYGLPVQAPMEGGDVLARVLTEPEFERYRGVVPHYCLTVDKRDCGLGMMRAIAALGQRGKLRPAE